MAELPIEIWRLIARNLHKSQLRQLRSLNSFFLNFWMEVSWKRVVIDTEFPDQAVRALSRMVDPFVATRTKRLTVCLRHFKSLESPPSSSTLSKLTSIFFPKPRSQTTPPSPSPIFERAITHLLQSLPLLPNVTSLKIELWHIPIPLLPTLFETIISSPLAKTMQNLWLSGEVDMFALLDEYVGPEPNAESPFANLAEFKLELINPLIQFQQGDVLTLASNSASKSTHSIAQFIRSIAPSLQVLRIVNWSMTLDLSLFFSRLSEPLPNSPSLVPLTNLHSLFLILPFTSLRSSPESLHRFLLTHSSNLRHLQLRLKMRRVHLNPDVEEPLGTWLAKLVDNDAYDSAPLPKPCDSTFFPNVQNLDIYPSTTTAGLSAVLTLIRRIPPTLISLTIRDRYLTREEAKQVLDILTEGQPRQLNSLRMNITHLTVPFLNLLAHKLPRLQKLWLSVSEITGSDQYSFYDLLDKTSSQDEHRDLITWKLQDLSIWQAGQEMDDAVRAVAGAVPSVLLGNRDDELSDEE